MRIHKISSAALLLSFAAMTTLFFTSCMFFLDQESDATISVPGVTGSLGIDASTRVTAISFADNEIAKSVTISGLANQSVFLVQMNNSPSVADFSNLGTVASSSSMRAAEIPEDPVALSPVSGYFKGVRRLEHKPSAAFNSNPEAFLSNGSGSRSAITQQPSYSCSYTATGLTCGDTGTFKVDGVGVDTDGDGYGNSFTTINAKLRGQSTYANVWLATANDTDGLSVDTYTDDDLSTIEAQAIADAFTETYPAMTQLFGYEYGGGTATGGIDGDTRVNILIYDVVFDNADDPVTNGGIVGYFWAKDEYPTSYFSNSNEAEIFYIDSLWAKKKPGVMYSTLVHEFQHMINFNTKYLTNGKISDTWYNEMLSQVAEDMMSDNLENYLTTSYDVSTDGPVTARMPLFNYVYDYYGVTEWNNGETYSTAYGFGAYLARNYGGVDIVKAIAQNSLVDESSITNALTTLGKTESTFADAFKRYGEAIVYSSSVCSASVLSGVNTFSREASGTIGTTTYRFPAFDIWNMVYGTQTGPHIFDINYAYKSGIPGYSCNIQTGAIWTNVSDKLTVVLNRPTDSDIVMYLMVR